MSQLKATRSVASDRSQPSEVHQIYRYQPPKENEKLDRKVLHLLHVAVLPKAAGSDMSIGELSTPAEFRVQLPTI